nr:MAG TPA: hypothetical protein [Caudoviricetes sp.]
MYRLIDFTLRFIFSAICVCVYLTISYNKERENASCYGGFLSFLPKT